MLIVVAPTFLREKNLCVDLKIYFMTYIKLSFAYRSAVSYFSLHQTLSSKKSIFNALDGACSFWANDTLNLIFSTYNFSIFFIKVQGWVIDFINL